MNGFVFHIVSGDAFFSGVALLIIAALASTRSQPIWRRVTVIFFLLGLFAVAVSSTPIPYWSYAAAGVVTLVWIASSFFPKYRNQAAYVVIATWIFATCLEIPYHFTSPLAPINDRSITIIGDSVTAGVGGDETAERWPSILAREHQLQVQDISQMGETVASAHKRVQSHQVTGAIILVEIGGNDILGSTTSRQFAIDLDALLSHLATENRQVVMFELPLPPFYHEYGRIQRTTAAKHNVVLLPKRIFLSVIAGNDSTLDTIHLSQAGHQLMADKVWRIIGSAFGSNVSAL